MSRRRTPRRMRQYELALANVMRSVDGRRVLARIMTYGHPNAVSFSGDALRTAFLEGERNVALRLLADMQALAPDVTADILLTAKYTADEEHPSGRPDTDADPDPGYDPDPDPAD